jgi:ABC-type branched-subunit amino acid transport system ATPase component
MSTRPMARLMHCVAVPSSRTTPISPRWSPARGGKSAALKAICAPPVKSGEILFEGARIDGLSVRSSCERHRLRDEQRLIFASMSVMDNLVWRLHAPATQQWSGYPGRYRDSAELFPAAGETEA